MRLLPLMLLVVCCSASAEWIFISETETLERFIDIETLTKQGAKREFWILSNFKSNDGSRTRSGLSFFEMDCKKRIARKKQNNTYAGLWASGEILIDDNNVTEWEHIAPGTTGERMLKYVCSK
jgi:hypothetical protein